MERRIRTTLWAAAILAGVAVGVPGGIALGFVLADSRPGAAIACAALGVVGASFLVRLVGHRSAQLARPIRQLARSADEIGAGRVLPHPVPTGDPDIDRVATVLAAASSGLAERAAVRDERQRVFAHELSSQLRGPVTNLRLVVEAAERTDRSSHLISAAHAELDRLQVTVDHLLMLTRDRPPSAGSISLSAVANRAERRWTSRATDEGRQLNVTADRSLPPVCGSQADVDQIVDTLIDNALRHGGGHIFVTTRAIQGGAAIDVADQGAGIPAERTDRIFFHGRGDGSGLPIDDPDPAPVSAPVPANGEVGSATIGLATAKALAEANGGRLVLSSARPPRFSLILPTT